VSKKERPEVTLSNESLLRYVYGVEMILGLAANPDRRGFERRFGEFAATPPQAAAVYEILVADRARLLVSQEPLTKAVLSVIVTEAQRVKCPGPLQPQTPEMFVATADRCALLA